jgi:anti-sigma B factor antagonist
MPNWTGRGGGGARQSTQGLARARGRVTGAVAPRLSVEIETIGEGAAIARVSGEIDMSTVRSLSERLLPLSELGPAGVVVDLSDVSFMGAAGIHALEHAKAALERRRGRLAVVAPGGIPLRVLEVTGVAGPLGVVPTAEAAAVLVGASH